MEEGVLSRTALQGVEMCKKTMLELGGVTLLTSLCWYDCIAVWDICV